MSVPAEDLLPTESMVLCEGYYDRAFWAGLLRRLRCTDPGQQPGRSARRAVRDPWGDPVSHGQFAFLSPSGQFIRVVPCRGAGNILDSARDRLHLLATRDLRRLILNYDTDRDPAETAAGAAAAQNRVDGFVREFGGARAGDQWTVEKTTVALACWQAQDSPLDGLPGLQTLERLICAAVVAAYPARGPSVQRWLDTRPDSAQTGPKHYVWSFYAGWYAHHGAESFYQHVWEDERVATELESRLAHVGIWPVVAEMAV